MGRNYNYFCDQCGKSFGSESHLNLKSIHLTESVEKMNGEWKGKNLLPQYGAETHFCDSHCLCAYLEQKIYPENNVVGV